MFDVVNLVVDVEKILCFHTRVRAGVMHVYGGTATIQSLPVQARDVTSYFHNLELWHAFSGSTSRRTSTMTIALLACAGGVNRTIRLTTRNNAVFMKLAPKPYGVRQL